MRYKGKTVPEQSMDDKTIYALGFFDGVHMGHQALLRECRRIADETGCKAAALTFSSHPDALVFGQAPALINTVADRERLLRRFGMDRVVILPFDRHMMTMPWQTFFHMLVKQYGAEGLVCGHDFRFGRAGEGSAAKLQTVCAETGIPCVVVPEQKIDGITVSSTCIRSLLEAGEMERATRFLGHPHIISGTVVPGRHLGRTLGIPTANLVLPEALVRPMRGVYACKALVDGKTCLAVTNVGVRPTVDGGNVTVEPWILDFDGDLYGKALTLELYSFLRPERKFPDLDALRREIQRNALQTRQFFENT